VRKFDRVQDVVAWKARPASECVQCSPPKPAETEAVMRCRNRVCAVCKRQENFVVYSCDDFCHCPVFIAKSDCLEDTAANHTARRTWCLEGSELEVIVLLRVVGLEVSKDGWTRWV
jgi:hypothetical protein